MHRFLRLSKAIPRSKDASKTVRNSAHHATIWLQRIPTEQTETTAIPVVETMEGMSASFVAGVSFCDLSPIPHWKLAGNFGDVSDETPPTAVDR